MSFLLKIENIAKSSKILISNEPFFSRSKDRSRTHDQKCNAWNIRGLDVCPINQAYYIEICHIFYDDNLFKWQQYKQKWIDTASMPEKYCN